MTTYNKTESFPHDFILIVDTREQTPLFSKLPIGLTMVREKLGVGDYSIRGFTSEIVIERKSTMDFIQSISHGRDRFKNEILKMMTYKRAYIVVEDTLDVILGKHEIRPAGSWRGTKKGTVRPFATQTIMMHPNAIWGTIISINVRYGVHFFFADGKQEAERFVLSTLKKYFSLKRGGDL